MEYNAFDPYKHYTWVRVEDEQGRKKRLGCVNVRRLWDRPGAAETAKRWIGTDPRQEGKRTKRRVRRGPGESLTRRPLSEMAGALGEAVPGAGRVAGGDDRGDVDGLRAAGGAPQEAADDQRVRTLSAGDPAPEPGAGGGNLLQPEERSAAGDGFSDGAVGGVADRPSVLGHDGRRGGGSGSRQDILKELFLHTKLDTTGGREGGGVQTLIGSLSTGVRWLSRQILRKSFQTLIGSLSTKVRSMQQNQIILVSNPHR